jgi:hypothetical protein
MVGSVLRLPPRVLFRARSELARRLAARPRLSEPGFEMEDDAAGVLGHTVYLFGHDMIFFIEEG